MHFCEWKSTQTLPKMASHETIPLQSSSSFLSTSTIIALCVFFALLCACIVIGHLLEENRWANESITALLLVCAFLPVDLVFLMGSILFGCFIDHIYVSTGVVCWCHRFGYWKMAGFAVISVQWGFVLPLFASSNHFQCWVWSLYISIWSLTGCFWVVWGW